METTTEILKHEKYSSYKDSGLDWLGKIPVHWQILPGLAFIYENKERNKGMVRNTILSLSYGKIRIKAENELTGLVPESFETYQFVNKGDLIFRPTDLQNDTVSLRSSISEYDGIITNAYLNLRFKQKANSKFYHYFFRSIDNNKLIYGLGSGLRQNISYLDFRRFLFPFPPLQEQTAITNFLDDKTDKIDYAIGLKLKQIELLKERLQILIQRAVTKGLDSNVKMKDSGVEWIGEIPVNWKIEAFKNILNERNQKNSPIVSKERLSLSIDKGITLYSEKTTNLDRFKEDFTQYKIAHIGDLVFNSMNMIVGAVGVSDYFGCVSPVYYTYFEKTGDIDVTKYYQYYFKNKKIQSVLYSIGKGIMAIDRGEGKFNTVRLKVSRSDLRSMQIPRPSAFDIKNIIKYIESLNAKINQAVRIKEQEIEKLKEYRSSLIDGVITGKIKVC